MQKTELIAKVAKDTGMTQAETAKVVNSVLDSIVGALKSGEKVTMTGFGTFEVRHTAARVGTNPSTGQKIQVPAGRRASFSAGPVLKKAVSGKNGEGKSRGKGIGASGLPGNPRKKARPPKSRGKR